MALRVQSGQAAVESAIVLPLFVFLILGLLQLGLMHQARLMTKYAAYKAVRTGALHSVNVEKMERAALAVLLPLVSRSGGGAEFIKTVGRASDFQAKWSWPEVVANRMPDAGLKYAEVTVCGPLSGEFPGGMQEVDFDDPQMTASDDWGPSQRTKLRVQVTFNYRMPIPFANMVIFNIVRAREVTSVLRLGKPSAKEQAAAARPRFGRNSDAQYDAAGAAKHYIMPIRATYTMRMHSNLFLSTRPLPETNACVFSH